MKDTARQPGQDFMQATPRDWTIGKIADAFSATGSPERNQYIRMLANAFGLPAIGQTLDRISYGEPLTTGAGGIGGTTRPRPEAVEAAMAVSPFAAKFAQATKGMPVGMSIQNVAPTSAGSEAAQMAQMLQDIGTDPQTIYQRTGLIKSSGQWQ